jgi:hypothetical protein
VIVTPDSFDAEHVTVTVRDLFGRTVATLFTGAISAGEQRFSLPASVSAGHYVVAVEHDGAFVTSSFTVLR